MTRYSSTIVVVYEIKAITQTVIVYNVTRKFLAAKGSSDLSALNNQKLTGEWNFKHQLKQITNSSLYSRKISFSLI